MKGHGLTPRYWFSSDAQAVEEWLQARAQIMSKSPLDLAAKQAEMRSSYAEEDRKPVFGDGSQDYMMQRYKNLALIQISGNLVQRDSYWNRYFGAVSYDEIRRSVLMALKDTSVDGILAVMGTPGGTVSGVDTLATFFSRADQTKPFYSFAETEMCSGGYYLGAPSREIYAQRAAQVGSIGVIMIHMDVSDMYKEMGISPTVFRAGEFKALGTPYEKLDKRARENIQGTLDSYFQMFNEHVVDCRGFKDVPDLLAEAGEGRVFMADKAKEVGLVDQVAELEDCLEDVSAKVQRSSGKKTQFAINQQSRTTAMGTTATGAKAKALTAEQIALLAAGGTLDDQSADTSAQAAPNAEGDDPATKPAVTAEPAQPAAESGQLLDKVLALGTENAQLKADLKTEQTAKADLATQVEGLQATIKGLATIVCQAIGHRQIALGYQPSDVSALTPDQQIEQFAKLDAEFKTRFSSGPASRPAQAESREGGPALSPVAVAAQNMTGKL